jgi:hypothetical protein
VGQEIEVTFEMALAGAQVINDYSGSMDQHSLATRVYIAMAAIASRESADSPAASKHTGEENQGGS